MTIREFKISDYDGVYALWMRTPNMGLNSVDDSRDGIKKYIDRNPHTSFVAEQENEIIGVILGGHDGRRGFLIHACVAAEHKRRGIGRKLADAALEALKKEGITKVALVAFEKNEDGNNFWERIGFTARPDLVYRNKSIIDTARIDT